MPPGKHQHKEGNESEQRLHAHDLDEVFHAHETECVENQIVQILIRQDHLVHSNEHRVQRHLGIHAQPSCNLSNWLAEASADGQWRQQEIQCESGDEYNHGNSSCGQCLQHRHKQLGHHLAGTNVTRRHADTQAGDAEENHTKVYLLDVLVIGDLDAREERNQGMTANAQSRGTP